MSAIEHDGCFIHPSAPAGGGGPGQFRSAIPLYYTCELSRSDFLGNAFDAVNPPLELFDVTVDGVKWIAATEAFRKYSWLSGAVKNSSGNLRGMVINARAHQVYLVAEKYGEVLKKAGTILALAEEVYRAYDEAAAIVDSEEDLATKSAKLLALTGGTIVARWPWNMFHGVVDTALWLTEKTKYVNPTYWYQEVVHVKVLGRRNTFDEDIEFTRRAMQRADVKVRQFSSGENLYNIMNVTIHGR